MFNDDKCEIKFKCFACAIITNANQKTTTMLRENSGMFTVHVLLFIYTYACLFRTVQHIPMHATESVEFRIY